MGIDNIVNQEANLADQGKSIPDSSPHSLDLVDVVTAWGARKGRIALVTVAAGAIAFGLTYLMPLTYTARTTFIPPQQQQSAASTLMSSLGALSGLSGGAASRSPAEQYVSLLQRENVANRIVDKFDLMKVYETRYRFGARGSLSRNSRISLGKKDGLITVEVDAASPQLAADIANQYVAELRRMSSELVLSEAQERRVFFEAKLKETRTALEAAQAALQRSGFDAGALRAEPRTAAEAYAHIRAEITTAEIRLQTTRRAFADSSPEVQQQLVTLSALKSQAAKLESRSDADRGDAGYVATYREYKYQEGLFEAFSKQYEMARLDESREGASVQVVDVAALPEYKSKPKRAAVALSVAMAALVAMLVGIAAVQWWRVAMRDPVTGPRLQRLRAAAALRKRQTS